MSEEAVQTEETASVPSRTKIIKKRPSRSSKGHSASEGAATNPRKRGGRKPGSRNIAHKYDWPRIFQEFIEGYQIEGEAEDHRVFPNLRELSDRHGVNYLTMRDRAGKERWTEKKQEFQAKVILERQRKRATTLAKNAADFDERTYNTANMGVTLIQTRFAEIAQELARSRARRELALQNLEAGLPDDKKDLYSAVYHQEMQGLANALDRLQNVGMRALGTDVRKIELSGNDGGDITINVQHELTRDDPERAAAAFAAMLDAGQLRAGLLEALQDEGDIVDAEVVEDTPSEEAPAS